MKEAIKNVQSRETFYIGHTRHRTKTNETLECNTKKQTENMSNTELSKNLR
jgi:hypothetical protein